MGIFVYRRKFGTPFVINYFVYLFIQNNASDLIKMILNHAFMTFCHKNDNFIILIINSYSILMTHKTGIR